MSMQLTLDQLQKLRLKGMMQALSEQMEQSIYASLSFEERLMHLVDREVILRENNQLSSRLKKSKLKQNIVMEELDFTSARGLDRQVLAQLSHCQWVKEHRNILIVGPTGTGKTFLACALAHKACLEGYSVSYQRMPRLMGELSLGRGDGSYAKRMKELSKSRILILDDWGLVPLELTQRRDLLEILEDRQGNGSTLITSQLPVKLWHEAINDATLADAILDRVVHNAYRIELRGESMRKIKAKALTEGGE